MEEGNTLNEVNELLRMEMANVPVRTLQSHHLFQTLLMDLENVSAAVVDLEEVDTIKFLHHMNPFKSSRMNFLTNNTFFGAAIGSRAFRRVPKFVDIVSLLLVLLLLGAGRCIFNYS